jgi:hypothetical protein
MTVAKAQLLTKQAEQYLEVVGYQYRTGRIKFKNGLSRAYNSSNSGGRYQEDHSSKPAPGK